MTIFHKINSVGPGRSQIEFAFNEILWRFKTLYWGYGIPDTTLDYIYIKSRLTQFKIINPLNNKDPCSDLNY